MAELYNEMLIRSVDCGLLYFQIKDNEAIKEYEDLKKEDFERAMTFIGNWYPSYPLKQEIERINAQTSLEV